MEWFSVTNRAGKFLGHIINELKIHFMSVKGFKTDENWYQGQRIFII